MAPVTETLPTAQELVDQLERLPDAHGELAIAWRLVVIQHGVAGRYAEGQKAAAECVKHARVSGNERLVAKVGGNLADFALLGPMPVEQAIAACEKLISDGLSDRHVECRVMCKLAQLRAMHGDVAAGRELYKRARAMLREMGQGVFATTTGTDLAKIAFHGDDFGPVEQEIRRDLAYLTQKGERYYRSTMAALLARLVRDQGRDDDALELTQVAESCAASDDQEVQALWRCFRAPILARRGQHEAAEAMAREAVDLVAAMESPALKADTLAELAAVLHLVGKTDEARDVLALAIDQFEAKGDVVLAQRWTNWSVKALPPK